MVYLGSSKFVKSLKDVLEVIKPGSVLPSFSWKELELQSCMIGRAHPSTGGARAGFPLLFRALSRPVAVVFTEHSFMDFPAKQT